MSPLVSKRHEADQFYKEALQFFMKNQFKEALNAIGSAIEFTPNRADLYAARGFFYLQKGGRADKNKALADFETALEIFPYEMLAHYGRGMVAYKAKEWEEATTHFTQAYRTRPERPETCYYLALSHHHQGQNVLALPLMQQAHSRFEEKGDKRRTDANRWLRQLEKLIDEQAKLPPPSVL
jgi:tetratricopeptide (TPR) repeat protein